MGANGETCRRGSQYSTLTQPSLRAERSNPRIVSFAGWRREDVLRSLLLYGAIGVAGVASKKELVVVALSGEDPRHVFIGENPIVEMVAHDVGIKEIAVSDFKPQPQWLARRFAGSAYPNRLDQHERAYSEVAYRRS